jgi:hypothetical protein
MSRRLITAAHLLIWRKRAGSLFALDEQGTQRMLVWAGMQPAFNCKEFNSMTALIVYSVWCAAFILGCLWIAWTAARELERLRRVRVRGAPVREHSRRRQRKARVAAACRLRTPSLGATPVAMAHGKAAHALWQGRTGQ